METYIKKLLDYSTPVPETGCWLWEKCVDKNGYGLTSYLGRQYRAPRLSYELFIGSIPDSYVVCHKCDTPLCINPKHLFVATQKENLEDAATKGRMNQPHGEQHPHTRLTEAQVYYILGSDERNTILAKELGVKQHTISSIRSGKRWKHIKRDNKEWEAP